MPCGKVARGIANTALPPPFNTPAAPTLPFKDSIDNNPCGRRIISTANGVSVASHACCLPHLIMKLGQAAVAPPYVDAA